MKLDANKKILIVVALVLYLLYKMMGGWWDTGQDD